MAWIFTGLAGADNSWKLLLLPSVIFRNKSKMILEEVNAETLMISNDSDNNNDNDNDNDNNNDNDDNSANANANANANVNANNILFLYSATSNCSYFFTIA